MGSFKIILSCHETWTDTTLPQCRSGGNQQVVGDPVAKLLVDHVVPVVAVLFGERPGGGALRGGGGAGVERQALEMTASTQF